VSLLTICQAVADEVFINRPLTVIGNTQPETQKLLRIAQKVGKGLMKGVVWSALRKEKTFTALATETQTAILPSDFDRIIPETFWDRSGVKLLTGPITSAEWQSLKANSYSGDKKFIIRGGSLLTIPVFAGGESLAFEYVSNLWCTDSTGVTGKSAWALDADIPVLDEELHIRSMIFVYLDGEGQPSEAAAKDFEDYANTLLENDQPSAGVMVSADIFGGSRHFGGVPGINVDTINVM